MAGAVRRSVVGAGPLVAPPHRPAVSPDPNPAADKLLEEGEMSVDAIESGVLPVSLLTVSRFS